jgi:hypothetical protein
MLFYIYVQIYCLSSTLKMICCVPIMFVSLLWTSDGETRLY